MDDPGEMIPESGIIRLSDAAWAEARRRAEVIVPIADRDVVPRIIAKEAAQTLGLSVRTVYNLVRRWKESDRSIISLAPSNSGGGKGQSRLPDTVERLITATIAELYLSRQRVSIAYLMRDIRGRCRKSGIKPPSLNTVRSRIIRLRPDEVARTRHGRRAARRFNIVDGQFPVTSHPLDVVQVDHTRVDLVVVDPYTREPIGRPWITVAIDVHTRCIVGICLTLEAPSAVSVGLCLAHAAMDKKPWLEQIGVQTEWPMAGKPKVLHVDNGSDFHSEALRRG